VTYFDFPPRYDHRHLVELVARANSWLADNKRWKVKCLETVPYPPLKNKLINANQVVGHLDDDSDLSGRIIDYIDVKMVVFRCLQVVCQFLTSICV
jgi:hypothetical protein